MNISLILFLAAIVFSVISSIVRKAMERAEAQKMQEERRRQLAEAERAARSNRPNAGQQQVLVPPGQRTGAPPTAPGRGVPIPAPPTQPAPPRSPAAIQRAQQERLRALREQQRRKVEAERAAAAAGRTPGSVGTRTPVPTPARTTQPQPQQRRRERPPQAQPARTPSVQPIPDEIAAQGIDAIPVGRQRSKKTTLKRADLRRAIIMTEVLSPPVSERTDRQSLI